MRQTAALLDQRLTLLWRGSRTAPPRQKTLQVMLDRSFGLLTGLERVILRKLVIFVDAVPTIHGTIGKKGWLTPADPEWCDRETMEARDAGIQSAGDRRVPIPERKSLRYHLC
ncbi:MAG: hypothetical protein WDM86_01380 [Rhizomicrobium sp.]